MRNKVYKIDNDEKISDIKSFVYGIFIYSIVLMLSSYLFEGIEIANFLYALIASLILSLLNYMLKPLLVILTLPITIGTYGILYPLSNMIILWLCSLIMGNTFQIGSFLSLFFISIFISLLRIILNYFLGGR